MTPYKSKKSFKTRLVIAISIVNLAVILAITYLTYRWNAQQLQEQTITQTQQTIEQAGTNVSNYMDELYRLTLTPYYNDEVLSQLEYSPTNSRDKLNSKRIVEGFLSSVMTLPRSEILRVCRPLPFRARYGIQQRLPQRFPAFGCPMQGSHQS